MLPLRTRTSNPEPGLNFQTGRWTHIPTRGELHNLARRVAKCRKNVVGEEGRIGETSRPQEARLDGMVGTRPEIANARFVRTSAGSATVVANKGTSPVSADDHLSNSSRERETAKAAVNKRRTADGGYELYRVTCAAGLSRGTTCRLASTFH